MTASADQTQLNLPLAAQGPSTDDNAGLGKKGVVTYDRPMSLIVDMDNHYCKPASADLLIDAVADCVPLVGSGDFTERFLNVVKLIGAGQVTAFAYEPDKVDCLLSRNFLSEDKGGTLAAAYVDGWFRDDPLFERATNMSANHCAVERLEDLLPSIDSRYLAMFFGSAGFRTKVAVLVGQDSLRMVLNLYFEGEIDDRSAHSPQRVEASLYRLIGRTLATHFLRLKPPEFPLPLAVLSERERQVCIGMLAGKKAEIIAQEIGVGSSSVVTYRQRAYQKLGISSRGQLFSICRSWHPQQRQASPVSQ